MATTKVLKTLAYFDLFDYPLTKKELEFWADSSKVSERFVSQKNSYFFLKGRDELASKREERRKISENKRKSLAFIFSMFKIISTVKAVFLTGSLAMENADEDGDIDILVVTSANFLWPTRLLAVGLLMAAGRYRRRHKVKNMVCPNIFLDENFLDLSSQKSLFAAHEILQAKPIFDRERHYKRFIEANSWVGEYLPEAYKNTVKQFDKSPTRRKRGGSDSLSSWLNNLAFRAQRKFMLKKMTHEQISLHQAFFHPRKLSFLIEKTYQKRLAKMKINFLSY